MRALVFDRFGGPEVYRIAEMPVPEPGEGEIQVRVDGAGMNPADWKIREGLFSPPEKFPAIALHEFSGIVTKLGPGVQGFEVGEGVYGHTLKGAAAEYTVAPVTATAARPPAMDPADAALVPLAGMTAWQALFDHGHLQRGQRVLIHGAGGGVGTYAVQLAKWAGAYVVGTAAREHHSMLSELGADELVDYQTQKFEDVVHDMDLVIHTIGQDQVLNSLKTLKPGGRLVALSADPLSEEAEKQGKVSVGMSMKPVAEQLTRLAGLIQDLQVRPVIDTIVPLEEAAEAMTELQRGHATGKLGVRLR